MYTELEPRVERLETVLGEFIVHTDMSLTRLERIMEEDKKRAEEDWLRTEEYRKMAEEDRRKSEAEHKLRAEEDRKKTEEYNKRAEEDRRRSEAERKLRAEEDRKKTEEYNKRAEEDRRRSEAERKLRAEEDKKKAEEYDKKAEEYKQRALEDRKEMNKKWGELANKMGTLVEDIVAPNIPGLAKRLFGCEDIEFHGVRVTKRHSVDRAKRREFDVITVCDTKVIVNDTKATPRQNYIDDFIGFVKSKEFYAYFPEYKGRELIPIFASLCLTEALVKYLTKHKIYAMVMKDDTMDIVNFELVKKANK